MPTHRKNITLKPEHDEWLKAHAISLSRFVQMKIEEEIRKDYKKEKH